MYRQEDHGEGDHVGRRTGLNVYRGIVAYHGGNADMLREMVLPREIARSTPLSQILEFQQFVPKSFLVDRYAEINGSGTMPRPRGTNRP